MQLEHVGRLLELKVYESVNLGIGDAEVSATAGDYSASENEAERKQQGNGREA
jgi:hypothetical protein